MNYILSIDQGTSSSRAILFSKTGTPVKKAQKFIESTYPNPGWVEQNPEEIWQSVKDAIEEVLTDIHPKELICCGITNQRETTVLWDKQTGQVLGPAIVWQDRRTESHCQNLLNYQETIYKKTGLIINPYFSATKIQWILENNKKARMLAEQERLAFGTIDSFLIWRLSAGKKHITDITNASRTMLYNIYEEQWDEELLSLFAIPKHILPEVAACDDNFAVIDKKHFAQEIPITGVAGDQQAALIGQGCFEKGMIKATFGTGAFILMNTGRSPMVCHSQKLLSTIAYKLNNQTYYGVEGSIYHAGTTIKWLRDELGMLKSAAESEDLAQSLDSNEGVYLVSSFTGLGAPHWHNKASAIIVGLSQKTQRAHFARAALEGLCYQVRDVLNCMQGSFDDQLSRMRVDGGMTENQWFLKFLADQCDLLVERPENIEITAWGVALIAAMGSGVFKLEDVKSYWKKGISLKPKEDRMLADKDYEGWKVALNRVFV
jgi:glycerol kinase